MPGAVGGQHEHRVGVGHTCPHSPERRLQHLHETRRQQLHLCPQLHSSLRPVVQAERAPSLWSKQMDHAEMSLRRLRTIGDYFGALAGPTSSDGESFWGSASSPLFQSCCVSLSLTPACCVTWVGCVLASAMRTQGRTAGGWGTAVLRTAPPMSVATLEPASFTSDF